MDALLTKGLEGLIGSGPIAILMGIALWWLLGKLTKEEGKVQAKDAEIKKLTSDLQEANSKISDAKDLCRIEILKVQDEGHREKMTLYERVMKVLEHVGGKE